MRPIRVVVLGTTVANGGDAALLEGELATLRDAFGDVEVTLFDQHPEVARRAHPGTEVRRTLTWPPPGPRGVGRNVAWVGRLLRLLGAARARARGRMRLARWLAPSDEDLADLERYRSADVALTPAGTMLVDQHTFLPRLVDWVIVLILRRPLVLFTQTLGDFRRPWDRALSRYVFRRAALVLVRGEDSRRVAVALGAPAARVHVAADPAFRLARVDRRTTGRRARVAVSVREWSWFAHADGRHRYEEAIRALCTHVVRTHGASVEFVSTCQGVPGYWTDDAAVAAQICEGLEPDVVARVTVDREHHTPTELRDRFAGFDLVVATRLHAGILALCAGAPVLAIAYEPKTREVFERLGAPDLVADIDALDGAWLIARIDEMLADPTSAARRLDDAVARERANAASVAGLVRAAVADPAPTVDPVAA